MVYVAGVDEAGRGPVIGPMVMCVAACESESMLKDLGVADSKLLSPEQRERIARVLFEKPDGFDYELIVLSPGEIDVAVNGKAHGDNLNNLEARSTAVLIHRLAQRVPIHRVIVDSPTKSTDKYGAELRAVLERIDTEGATKKIILQPEIKADFHHAIVGAASILAKVTRDQAIQAIAAKHGRIGSGYPADPDTQAFLAQNWHVEHEFFRKSWESYKRLANVKAQSSLADFGEKTEERAKTVHAFEALREHGFSFLPPTNQYEVVRMKNDAGVTVIAYTTGKVISQGPDAERSRTEALLAKLGLAPQGVEQKRPRGRPKKS